MREWNNLFEICFLKKILLEFLKGVLLNLWTENQHGTHAIKFVHPGISLEVQNVQKNHHENILIFFIIFGQLL